MSNTLFEKLKKFVDLNREEKSRPGERNLTRYPIAAAVGDRLVRVIQPRKSTDAPQHHPDVSLRGAKRRDSLAGPGPITGQPRRIRRLLREIATSAYGLLAMTNLVAGAVGGVHRNLQLPMALTERRYSQTWQRIRSAMPFPFRQCLPEIATSAYGLLAMTSRGLSPF